MMINCSNLCDVVAIAEVTNRLEFEFLILVILLFLHLREPPHNIDVCLGSLSC